MGVSFCDPVNYEPEDPPAEQQNYDEDSVASDVLAAWMALVFRNRFLIHSLCS
jgi:hypothetical protein